MWVTVLCVNRKPANCLFVPEMFTPSFPFFPHLSDSHIFLSSLSLPSAHPFLNISTDPFPSEVQCPFSALPFFISTFLGSLDCLLHTQMGSWWWNVLLLKAKYSFLLRKKCCFSREWVCARGGGLFGWRRCPGMEWVSVVLMSLIEL